MSKRQASSFYPHFAIEERPTIDHFVGLFNRLLFTGQPILTDFLDPRERQIMEAIAGGEALLQSFGGYEEAEKQRLYLSLDWENLRPDDYQLELFEIVYPQKFASLRHSQILGSLANSGVQLATFGDIVTDGQGRWQFFAEKELSNFFESQIDRIGPVKVRLEKKPLKELLEVEDNSQTVSAVAASLRLDAVLAAVTHRSRSQLKTALEAGEVRLNWHKESKAEKILQPGDLLSLRHFGRLRLLSVQPSRKGRLKLECRFWPAKRK
ncbi:YlmH family RNA-binding protein [Lactobacillus nasalidis]|nr:YlmH/Sll1252 family protein [Lactobacillus nasalidis]